LKQLGKETKIENKAINSEVGIDQSNDMRCSIEVYAKIQVGKVNALFR
jgi:hypothetical protein